MTLARAGSSDSKQIVVGYFNPCDHPLVLLRWNRTGLGAGLDSMLFPKPYFEYSLVSRSRQFRMEPRPSPFVEFLDRVDYQARISY